MKRHYTGNTDKSCQEKACEPLWDRPVSMDQIHLSFLGNPKGIEELGEYEKGKLHGSHETLPDIFQDPCVITESLKSQGVEIGKARNMDFIPDFMSLTPIIMGSEDLELDSKLLQFFAEAENKDPGGISRKSGKGGCDNQNSQCLPKEIGGYLRSLLYSMSNHMPKKRLCRPLTRVKTRAMALIRGMAP